MSFDDPTKVTHLQALGPDHRPAWDCPCGPLRTEVIGQAIAVHRTEQVPDLEVCRLSQNGKPCPNRAWSNGYCGPHQPAGPYGRSSRKVAKPLDSAAR